MNKILKIIFVNNRKLAIILSIILFVAVFLLIYFLTGTLKKTEYQKPSIKEFSTDGFADSMTLSDKNKKVSENDNFILYIDETTSYFKAYDKRSGEYLESNPTVLDPWQTDPNRTITNSALEKQKSTLELTYSNSAGSVTSMNNYNLSIYHPESLNGDPEGTRTYSIKYVENGFQVLYNIGDTNVDYLYFPKYLSSAELIEYTAMLSRQQAGRLEFIYKSYDQDRDLYEILSYVDMSRNDITVLYEIFYKVLDIDYSREKAIEANASYGYYEQFEKPRFTVGVAVILDIEGVSTSIIRNSIIEPSNLKLGTISLYPLFGTAISKIDNRDSRGYLVIPDGSGAVIEFNNGKHYQTAYRKRLYGDDLSLLPDKMAEQQQKNDLPLYGMIKEKSGFAAIITEGDAMTYINADVSGRIDSYNKIYPTFLLRENESVVLGSGFNIYGINLWTDEIVSTDFTVKFVLLTGSQNNYVGIAHAYREYLVEQYAFISKDQSTDTVLTVEVLGAYDVRKFFVGVPYTSLESLTTFKEAQVIIDALLNQGIANINVNYLATSNGGLKSDLSDKIKIENVLGGRKSYLELVDYLGQKGISSYLNVNFMTTSGYNRLFDQYRYNSTRLKGALSYDYAYHYPSRLPYTDFGIANSNDSLFVINPLYYQDLYRKMIQNETISNFSYSDLGSILAGNYSKNDLIYKQDALNIQNDLMSTIEKNLMLSDPLGFAIPYADFIINLPHETTLYAIVDYAIPLLQLVISGYVDYSADSINLPSDRSRTYLFLKAIETGSNLKYTLTYDSSIELLNTTHNEYMSTHYLDWLDDIKNQVGALNQLKIHQGYLVSHERLLPNVIKVGYSNGVEIIINYQLTSVLVDSISIPSMSYFVVKGA